MASQRFALQVTVGQRTHDKLRYAQALLGHQIPSGDLAEVLDRALDALIGQLEKRTFAATDRPRPGRRRSAAAGRQVPAHVKRAVWERDGGRCTFASGAGRRCPARTLLEFDHIDEVARGGRATVPGMRLRCRAHNQFGAERTFGIGFMSHKRENARRAADEKRAAKAQAATGARAAADARAAAEARAAAAAAERAKELDVVPWLRQLGFRVDEARRAAALCESLPDAPLEERLRLALAFLRPPHRRVGSGTEIPN